LQTLMLSESVAEQKEAILTATNDAGLMTRPVWTLTHRLAPYSECPKMGLPVAESLEQRLINLPSSTWLGRQDLR
jgi:perosamine synthetase